MVAPPPRVFISYAWGDDNYKARVLRLAAALRTEAGVDVVLDSWDLRAGQDMTVFMERVVGDPSITNVLLLLDANYVRKADARRGGVGTETQLISPEVYSDPHQTRFVPVLFNAVEWTNVPLYLRPRLYLDFSTEEAWAANWPTLVRHLHQVEPVRPALGSKPLDLLYGEAPRQNPTPAPARVIPTDLAAPYKQIYDRLHQMLDWHGLDSLRAATLLAPYGFSPGVLASPSRTVEHLDEAALTFITSYFQVSREFVLGRSWEPGVRAGDWYKHPRRLCQRIAELHVSDQLGTVFFIARQSSKVLGDRRKRRFPPSLTEPDEDLFVLLTLRRQVDGHEFHSYEVWEAGRWSYEKCRLDLKAIALFCQRLNQKRNLFFFMGGALPDDQFEAVTQCRRHIAELVEDGYIGLSPKWYPDDYVSDAPHLAKETNEMPRVLEWYERYELERVIEAVPARSDEDMG